MSCDNAVRVSQVSKSYQLYRKPVDRLHQWLFGRWRQYGRQFWAIRDLSFEVPRGEVLGILGKNGSGKSTLLQMICGCVTPSSGEIVTQGRIAALLELGSGFHPEFSGLENVYLNARLLGLKQGEVAARLDTILAFADIGPFIHNPVKSYSSGMVIRLAFAVAAAIEPDILIVDEALAVGDVQFQAKCFRHFNRLIEHGTTIILVTQSPEQVMRYCSRALLLEQGRLAEEGQPKVVVNRYLDRLFGRKSSASTAEAVSQQPAMDDDLAHQEKGIDPLAIPFEQQAGYNPSEYRWGNRTATIQAFHLAKVGAKEHQTRFVTGDQLSITLVVEFLQACQRPIFGVTIKTPGGITVYGSNSRDCQPAVTATSQVAGGRAIVNFELTLWLTQGDYLLSFDLSMDEYGEIIPLDRRYDAVHIVLSSPHGGVGLAELQMRCREQLIETLSTANQE